MKDKYFLDTNIFVYTFDTNAPSKQKIALELINTALTLQNGVISYQVTQEFLNVATQKFKSPLSNEEAKLYLHKVLWPLCEIYPDIQLYETALEIKQQMHFSFYDALIITAAIKANCKILYSEDLQHGQHIYNLTVKNPFQ